MLHLTHGPRRIVCLTEEPTEILYLLGAQARIVGISAYTERPPQAKRDKPVVSAFIGGSVEKICALAPDLVIGFSDIQADLAAKLIARNLQVLIWNQRSIQQILDVILALGRLVDAADRARELVLGYMQRIQSLREAARALKRRPRVYFEEWDHPTITAIHWISELIEIAGGENVFADRAPGKSAQERTVTFEEVVARAPDLCICCWCGKPFDRDAFLARPGFARLPAVVAGQVHELPPEIVLQPGPAALTDGLDALLGLIESWRRRDEP
jgi:iron complex transport system substrate-binding protein